MNPATSKPIVVAVCGASGQIYGRWLIRRLGELGREVHLIVSKESDAICRHELGLEQITDALNLEAVVVHDNERMDSSLASGSYPTAGMIICPCTLNTLAAAAGGISDNLIKRAAQVHLKQRRPIVFAVREMPISLIDLENMAALTKAGAVIAPLAPSFYHRPKDIDDLVCNTAERLIELITGIAPSHRYGG